jgi:DNA-binding IclR family transcriptional regulator
MTKRRVLEIFAATAQFMTPDEVCKRLRLYRPRSSVYSYLLRLHKQGLLEQDKRYGRLVYRIRPRGIERLRFLQTREERKRDRLI